MSGKLDGESTEDNDEAYENNLRYAVGILEKENIMGLIEPINIYANPSYYMNSYDKGKYKLPLFKHRINTQYRRTHFTL